MTVHEGDTYTMVAQICGDRDLTGATVLLRIERQDGTRTERAGVVAPTVNGQPTNSRTVGADVGATSPWIEGFARCQFLLTLGAQSFALDEFQVRVARRIDAP